MGGGRGTAVCKSNQFPRSFWYPPQFSSHWCYFAKEEEREILPNQGSKFLRPSLLKVWSKARNDISWDLLGKQHLRPRP